MDFYLSLALRLLLACILGGLIGYERESMHRPAGFRTHILVCVGSTLVMITSEFVFKKYIGQVQLDPTRMGAQVISGIGFLGAGTIIREGFSVKGLTTAASLWAVSCVGIATGIGFYEGAIAATILIYITLILLRKMEHLFSKKSEFKTLSIQAYNQPGQFGKISQVMDQFGVPVKKIEFMNHENEKTILVKILISAAPNFDSSKLVKELIATEGVQKISEE